MKLLHKGLVLISVPLAFGIVFAFGFGTLLKKSVAQLQAEKHAKEVIARAERIHVLLGEGSISIGLQTRDRQDEIRKRHSEIWDEIETNFKVLRKLIGNKRSSLARQIWDHINGIRKVQQFGLLTASIPRPDIDPNAAPDPAAVQIAQRFLDWYINRDEEQARSAIGGLLQSELKSVRQGPKLHAEINQQFKAFLLFGICADLILLTGLGIYFGSSIESRLRSLMLTTERLAKGEDLAPLIHGNDELALLDLLLHNTAAQIITTQRFKKQLLAVVCHELKAPLSAIQILLSLLAKDISSMSEKAAATIQRASKACNRLQLMVTELLDLESMNADKIQLRYRTVKPKEFMETAAEMVAAIAKDQSIELLLEPCDIEVSIDPDRMIQVLVNLLSNAIKFSPPNTKVCLIAKQNGDKLELSVTDQGPGIPEELQANLFDVFSQGEQSSTKIKGTGMGLSISKAIVTAHGGTIKIISQPGEGSTFQIMLPKEAGMALSAKQAATAAPAIAGTPGKTEKPIQFRIRYKGMILIGLPVLTQVVLLGSLAMLLKEANIHIDNEAKARKVVSDSQKVVQEMADSAILTLLCGIHLDVNNLYNQQEKRIHETIKKFKETCADDPERRAVSEQIEKSAEKINETQKWILAESRKRRLSVETVDKNLIQGYHASWNELSTEVDNLAAREESLEANGAKVLKSIVKDLDRILLLGLAANVLSAIGMTVYLSQNINKRIIHVQQNAERILKKEPLLPPVSGRDEIAQLDKAFHDAADSLKQEQELKQRLLAIASHELRSPLSGILMSLGLISAGVVGEISEKNATRIKQAEQGTERLISLINDILDIEKMEAGKFVLKIEDLQSATLATRAIAYVQPLAEKRKIMLVNKSEDMQIKADSERLVQVMINLLTNAIKFSSEGQSVCLSSNTNEQGEYIFCIEDSGKGISREMQERIFEDFVTSTGDDNSDGTGLGLPISKRIVEQHGGKIGCQSIEGKGAIFWFSIPLASS